MEFKIIKDFENYIIYKNGDVYSKVRRGGGGFKKKILNKQGYYTIAFTKNNKIYNRCLHRLIAEAFIPNPDNKPCVDHIDRNRLNNNIDNLRWVSYAENNLNKNIKGSIYINKIIKNEIKYEYIRASVSVNQKKINKNFKSKEEAQKWIDEMLTHHTFF
tara:strand:- start:785 stop:1261 length:477 start_codon:yes stop_codon:yes gene_type:complete